MSMYVEWGFSDNPFQTTALPPSQLGSELLVGRDLELSQLMRRLKNPPRLPTLEGLNGVGKSSLVNVAAYRCFEEFLTDPDRPMLIPCRKVFQLRQDADLDSFVDDVLREVAQTLIEGVKRIEGLPAETLDTSIQLNRWLNSPQVKSFQGGIGCLTGGFSSETNTGEGFTRSGFRKAVSNWLEILFPTPRNGAVVCIIDNLELLQTSENARRCLEALRDELLVAHGLRWVLCGALGVVLGVASSPRLEGLLHSPLEIGGVDDRFIMDIFASRVRAFSVKDAPYLPITVADFHRLYDILAHNLRSLLGHADEYCQWVCDRDLPNVEGQKTAMFDIWLADISEKALYSTQSQLRPRAWEIFEIALSMGGHSLRVTIRFSAATASQRLGHMFETLRLPALSSLHRMKETRGVGLCK